MDFEQADVLNAVIRAVAIRHRALAGALLAPLGLHPGQEVLLIELAAHGPRSQGQLAVAAGCEPPTITGSVRRLEAAGFVQRRPSPTDARVTIVELSDRGRALLPDLRAAWCQLAERSLEGLTTTDYDELCSVLSDLQNSLDRADSRADSRPDT